MVDRRLRDKTAATLQSLIDGHPEDYVNSDLADIFEDYLDNPVDPAIDAVLDRYSSADLKAIAQAVSERKCSSSTIVSIEKAILFLKTDREYEGTPAKEMPWYMALPVTLLFIFAALVAVTAGEIAYTMLTERGVKADHVMCLFSFAFVFAILFLLMWDKIQIKLKRVNRPYWPFKNEKDYEAAASSFTEINLEQ